MRTVRGCMGADMSHSGPMAERITATLVQTLAEQGFTRPQGDSLVVDGSGKWDRAVGVIQDALREMLELDACDKF